MKTHAVLELRGVLTALTKLDATHGLVLSGTKRLRLARALREANDAQADFDSAHDNLVRRLGTDDGQGRIVIRRDTPNHAEYMKELTALLEAEMESVAPLRFTEAEIAQNCDKLQEKFPLALVGQLDLLGAIEPSPLPSIHSTQAAA